MNDPRYFQKRKHHLQPKGVFPDTAIRWHYFCSSSCVAARVMCACAQSNSTHKPGCNQRLVCRQKEGEQVKIIMIILNYFNKLRSGTHRQTSLAIMKSCRYNVSLLLYECHKFPVYKAQISVVLHDMLQTKKESCRKIATYQLCLC